MAKLKLKNIRKDYENGFVAVDNFSLDIEDKEFIVLVGPSGCGKSTTLRMIAGLEEISDGELYIGDQLVNDVEPKERDIAMVFQNYALYPHMTVYDNMAFGLKLRKIPKSEIDAKVREAANILDIAHLLDRKPKALSGGQRQRVAMGRAIVRNPKVFLMDEPLSNLDAKLRVQMRTEIAKLHSKLETTFIYVTHDQTEAMTLGSRIVVMKDGVCQQVDTPKEIYNNPKNMFVASFIGSPQMNFIYGKLSLDDSNKLMLQDMIVDLDKDKAELIRNKVTDSEVIVGFRPENVVILDDDNEKGLLGEVEAIENMGSEYYVHVKFLNKSIIIRSDLEFNKSIGEIVKFIPKEDKLKIFDKETQEALY